MKKIFFLILILLLSLISSCGASNCGDKQGYDFKAIEEIHKMFQTYQLEIKSIEITGSSKTFNVSENSQAIYYSTQNGAYLIDKNSNVTYSINHVNQTKTEANSETFNQNSIRTNVMSYLTAHLEIANSDFVKLEDQEVIANVLCDVYELETQYIEGMDSVERYYVSAEDGCCLKRYLKTNVGSVQTIASWEVTEFSLDAEIISSTINSYLNYELAEQTEMFDKWPDTRLGLMLPEFKKGTFVVGTDKGYECYIYYQDVSLQDIKSYANSLVNYHFEEGKNVTNIANQFIHITYNSDNVLVKIKYEPTGEVSITIKESTLEEISLELEKLQ